MQGVKMAGSCLVKTEFILDKRSIFVEIYVANIKLFKVVMFSELYNSHNV